MNKSLAARILAAALALSAPLAFAGELTYDGLSLHQGFNFRKDIQDGLGFVTSLGVAGQTLKADISIVDPTGAQSSAAAVLRSASWKGGTTDPIALRFNVSTANKNAIQGLLQKNLANTTASVAFTVWQYDQQARKYYAALQTTKPLSALIAREGKNKLLLLLPSKTPNGTVKSPENWDVELSIMPQTTEQSLKLCTTPTACMTKTWGVKVGR